jgi:hypothetical protein
MHAKANNQVVERGYEDMAKWQIKQHCGWRKRDGSPLFHGVEKVIKTFRYWWGAYFYKLWHYDFGAEPYWQVTFVWKIEMALSPSADNSQSC